MQKPNISLRIFCRTLFHLSWRHRCVIFIFDVALTSWKMFSFLFMWIKMLVFCRTSWTEYSTVRVITGHIWRKLFRFVSWIGLFLSSVRYPGPPDPHVFGSISQRYGSGSISQRYESGSFYHQAKTLRKTLIPTVLWLLLDFLSLKNYVNVPSKINKQKKF